MSSCGTGRLRYLWVSILPAQTVTPASCARIRSPDMSFSKIGEELLVGSYLAARFHSLNSSRPAVALRRDCSVPAPCGAIACL